jgi:hypothetical protein
MMGGDEMFDLHIAPDGLAAIGPAQLEQFDRDRRRRRRLTDGALFEFEQRDLYAHIEKASATGD